MNERLLVSPDIPLTLTPDNYEEFDGIQTTRALHRIETSEPDIAETVPSEET